MTYLDYESQVAPFSHKVEIIEYSENIGAFRAAVVEPECGRKLIWIDPFVCGHLPEEVTYENIIGKIVEVEYTHGWIFLAEGSRIVG